MFSKSNNIRVCAFCWKEDSLAVVRYESAFGVFEIGSFHPSQFPNILNSILLLYENTYFLIPSQLDDDIAGVFESKESINIKSVKNNDFSYSNGLDALDSMIFLVPEEQREDIKRSISSGIVDISSKAVQLSTFFLQNMMIKNMKEKIMVKT